MTALDPSLFQAAAIPAETQAANAGIMEIAKDLPKWWDVGAAQARAARARGLGPFPAAAKSTRARTVEIAGSAGTTIPLRVVAPERRRAVYSGYS